MNATVELVEAMDSSLYPYEKPYKKIRPRSGWQAIDLRGIWTARELLVTLAKRDITLRYRQTALGVSWVVLQPLAGAGIFAVVFGLIAHLPSEGIPYFIFSYAGLLAWNAFSATLTRASGCVVQNSHLVSKVFFPRLILPLSVIFSTVVDFVVALIMLLVLMAIDRVPLSRGVLLLPVWFALVLLLAVGIGFFCSALLVVYRDVQYVLPVLLQFGLYASPVAYSLSAVPTRFRSLYFLNPLTGLLEAFRWSLFGQGEMRWGFVVYSAFVTFIVFICGALVFRRMEPRFADVI